MTKVKRYKLNKYKLIRLVLFIVFIIIFFISINKIITWFSDNWKSKRQLNNLQNTIKIKEINGGENIGDNIDEFDPYWDFIKMKLISVDFKKLKKINNDTIGWIQVSGTNINYPFVQTNNNDFYLNHSFDKSKNGGGWLFMDYRNNKKEFDKNTIIYGHGRKNKTLFGSLKNILNNDWYDNTDNYIIKLSTEYENTMWQVFSIYRIPTTNDYLDIKFNSDKAFNSFSKVLIDRSVFDFKTKVNSNDKILTLSTCYNNNDKVVLHAKLIKRLKR